jgi:hypothetical protein
MSRGLVSLRISLVLALGAAACGSPPTADSNEGVELGTLMLITPM